MYRAITYEALRRGVSDEAAVTAMAETLTMDIFPKTDTMHVTVDGEDITDKLRRTDVSQHVSKIASMAGVRAVMVKLQREKALKGGIVLDGRDIGTVVLPQADVKIFLTASVKNRALRRFHEMKDNSESISLEDIEKNIQERDWQDSHRSVSPLKQAKDAILIDNSDMTLELSLIHI